MGPIIHLYSSPSKCFIDQGTFASPAPTPAPSRFASSSSSYHFSWLPSFSSLGNVCFFLLFRPVLATYGAFLPWGAVASLFFPCFCSPSWLLPCSPVLLFSVHHEPYNHHFTTKRLMSILFSSFHNESFCIGIGIGVGLLVQTYQGTTRNFRRRPR